MPNRDTLFAILQARGKVTGLDLFHRHPATRDRYDSIDALHQEMRELAETHDDVVLIDIGSVYKSLHHLGVLEARRKERVQENPPP